MEAKKVKVLKSGWAINWLNASEESTRFFYKEEEDGSQSIADRRTGAKKYATDKEAWAKGNELLDKKENAFPYFDIVWID